MNKLMKLSIFLSTIIITSALIITSCTPVTTTETQTVTLPPVTITTTQSPIAIQIVKDVTVTEAYAMIQDNSDNTAFTILDIRTPEEYAEGYIPGSILIDYRGDTWLSEVVALDRYDTYLVYCRTGNRSASAVEDMKLLNFAEVYSMQGGITDWMTAGYPVITPAPITTNSIEQPESISAEWLYLEHCAYCHFVEGDCEGVAPYPYGPSSDRIEEKIRGGVVGVMPVFQGVLTEEEIEALVKHLTIVPGESESEIPIEIINTGPVAVLFWEKCSVCHGDNRQGGVGPALIPERINVVDKNVLEKAIRDGQPGTSMPAWQDILTKQEIDDLVDYILSPVKD